MSLVNRYKKVGSKVVETTEIAPSSPMKIFNIVEANKRIAELEKQIENKAITPIVEKKSLYTPDKNKVAEGSVMDVLNDEIISTEKKTSPEKKEKVIYYRDLLNYSKIPPVFVMKHGYYLLYDGSKAYFQTKEKLNKGHNPLHLVKIDPPAGVNTELAPPPLEIGERLKFNRQNSIRQLSKTEFDMIVRSQPSITDLFQVYSKQTQLDYSNWGYTALKFDTAIAQILWS